MLKERPLVRLAVIGAGVMGANHARLASRTHGVALVAIVDVDEEKRTTLAAAMDVPHTESIDSLIATKSVDAVVIATPTPFHHPVAAQCIDAGLHVLVEKPIASTVEEGEDLAARAQKAGVVLTVGHVERFNPAVRELLRSVEKPIHLQLDRVGPFTPRVADNVVIDLMIHDLGLARALAGSEVSRTRRSARACAPRGRTWPSRCSSSRTA